MITALTLLRAIKTSEWSRYSAEGDSYATAGTTGPDAVNLRCRILWDNPRTPQPVEYQTVGDDQWYPARYSAVMRYDTAREITADGDGWEFIPYQVTALRASF